MTNQVALAPACSNKFIESAKTSPWHQSISRVINEAFCQLYGLFRSILEMVENFIFNLISLFQIWNFRKRVLFGEKVIN